MAGEKKPEQYHQVHDQENTVDPGIGRIRPLSTDRVEPVTLLALPKLAFNRYPLTVLFTPLSLESLEFSLVGFGHFPGATQGFAGKTDTPLVEVLSIVSCAVDRVTQHLLTPVKNSHYLPEDFECLISQGLIPRSLLRNYLNE